MAAGFVRFTLISALLILFVASTVESGRKGPPQAPHPGSCNKTTQQMLSDPCSRLELEVSTTERPRMICGTEIPNDIFTNHSAPKITHSSVKPDKAYTLIMVDPDAPSHKFPKYYLHWLCLNIQAKDLLTGSKLVCGSTPAAYAAPTPPPGTGLHRYQFFLFEQKNNNVNFKGTPARSQFDLMKHITTTNLCGPPAGAFEFKTQANPPI